jgi:uncharacterized protein
MKIDIFNHVMPQAYLELVKAHSKEAGMVKRMSSLRMLWDIEHRVAMLREKFGDVQQVLTLGLPSPELLGDAAHSPEYARVANDGMADMCRRWPKEFPAFVASLPMNNPDAAVREIDRAIDDLSATGVQIYTNVAGRPLDAPEYLPIFDRMAQRDLPIWMHPARPATFADYSGEKRSKFDMWWAFGWPYETSVAMGRLVFSGIFDRHPGLKIITHHLGAMVPFCAGRVGGGLDQLGSRSDDPEDTQALGRLRRRPIDYFKMFYGDTALFGAWHAMESGLAFFGVDHVLFGTDMPFDPEKGPGFIRDTIEAMTRMRTTEAEKAQIYEGNARRLLRLRLKS